MQAELEVFRANNFSLHAAGAFKLQPVGASFMPSPACYNAPTQAVTNNMVARRNACFQCGIL